MLHFPGILRSLQFKLVTAEKSLSFSTASSGFLLDNVQRRSRAEYKKDAKQRPKG
jgi:hypothetical protein